MGFFAFGSCPVSSGGLSSWRCACAPERYPNFSPLYPLDAGTLALCSALSCSDLFRSALVIIIEQELHGHLDVPRYYVVNPDYSPCSDYPVACWGVKLGDIVTRIRSRNLYVAKKNARVAQLNGIGFIWDRSEYIFDRILWAAKEYKRRKGKNDRILRVPQHFVIPEGGEGGWPVELGGFKLGEKLNSIRQKGVYIKSSPSRKAKLEEIGFQWTGNASLGWLEVSEAMRCKMQNAKCGRSR